MNLASCVLIGFCLLLYIHTLSFSYVNLDDSLLITESHIFLKNPNIIFSVFRQGVFTSLGRTEGVFYRPLLTSSFIIDSFLSGGNVIFSRLINIFLHGIASVLLFQFLFGITLRHFHSYFLSLIFAAHPIGVAIVAWLPGRNDSLLTIFILAAFLFFIHYHKKEKFRFFLLHITCYFLSLFIKETAMVLPILFFLYSLYLSKEKLTRRSMTCFVLSWIFLTFVFLYLRSLALPTDFPYAATDMIMNAIYQFTGVFVYFGKIFLPVQLSVYSELRDAVVWPGVLLLFFLISYVIIFRKNQGRVILFGIFWFFIFLLPTFTMVENYSDGVLRDQRVYLPFIGILLTLSETIHKVALLQRKTLQYLFLTVILLGLSYISYRHSLNFKNDIAFWKNAASTSPSSAVSFYNLGVSYTRLGADEKAEEVYKEAIRLRFVLPPGAYNNLGVIYLRKGNLIEAEKLFKKEIKLHPGFDIAKRNLELLYK